MKKKKNTEIKKCKTAVFYRQSASINFTPPSFSLSLFLDALCLGGGAGLIG